MLDDVLIVTCVQVLYQCLSNADREKERAEQKRREKESRRDIKFQKYIIMCVTIIINERKLLNYYRYMYMYVKSFFYNLLAVFLLAVQS